MNQSLSHKAATGAIWATIDKLGYMVIQFVVNLVLARILLPEDFGIIGMLTIFIVVSQTLIDGGFASALIQKKSPTEIDYSTIFYWNLVFSIILYLILYISAPWIASFYKMPLLSQVLRVIALTLPITGIQSVQRTRLQKSLAFKILAIVNISAYVVGSTIGIILAYNEYGVWSLVWIQIIYGIIAVTIMWILTRWVPKWKFSKHSLHALFGFGGYMMAANILQTVAQNLQGIIIGKRFAAVQMGYFSQAYKLDTVFSKSIPQVLVQVMYPIYAVLQDDRKKLNEAVCKNLGIISFVIYPILGSLILLAETLVNLLYGEKWLPCAPYFQVLCVGGLFICLQNLNFYAVAAVGKSKSLFRWSFFKWGFLLFALIGGAYIGIYGILWGMVISDINIFLVNAFLVSKHTGLSIMNQLKHVSPIFAIFTVAIAIAMVVCGRILNINSIIQTLVFLCIYVGGSVIGRIKAYRDTLDLVLNLNKHF